MSSPTSSQPLPLHGNTVSSASTSILPSQDPLVRSLAHLLPGRKKANDPCTHRRSRSPEGKEAEEDISPWDISDFEDDPSVCTSPSHSHRNSAMDEEEAIHATFELRVGEVPRSSVPAASSLSSSSSSSSSFRHRQSADDADDEPDPQEAREKNHSYAFSFKSAPSPKENKDPSFDGTIDGSRRTLWELVQSSSSSKRHSAPLHPTNGVALSHAHSDGVARQLPARGPSISFLAPSWLPFSGEEEGDDGGIEAGEGPLSSATATAAPPALSLSSSRRACGRRSGGSDGVKRGLDRLLKSVTAAQESEHRLARPWMDAPEGSTARLQRGLPPAPPRGGGGGGYGPPSSLWFSPGPPVRTGEAEGEEVWRGVEVSADTFARLPPHHQRTWIEEGHRRGRPVRTLGKPFHPFSFSEAHHLLPSFPCTSSRRRSSGGYYPPNPHSSSARHASSRAKNALDGFGVVLQSSCSSSSSSVARRKACTTARAEKGPITPVQQYVLQAYRHWRVHLSRWWASTAAYRSTSRTTFSLDGTGLRVAFLVETVEEMFHLIRLSGTIVGLAEGDMTPACGKALTSLQRRTAEKREEVERTVERDGRAFSSSSTATSEGNVENVVEGVREDRHATPTMRTPPKTPPPHSCGELPSSSAVPPIADRMESTERSCTITPRLALFLPSSLLPWLSSSLHPPHAIVYLGEPFYVFPSLSTLVSSYSVSTHSLLQADAKEYFRRYGRDPKEVWEATSRGGGGGAAEPPMAPFSLPANAPEAILHEREATEEEEEEEEGEGRRVRETMKRHDPSDREREEGPPSALAVEEEEEAFLTTPNGVADPSALDHFLDSTHHGSVITGASFPEDTPTPFRPCFFDPLQQRAGTISRWSLPSAEVRSEADGKTTRPLAMDSASVWEELGTMPKEKGTEEGWEGKERGCRVENERETTTSSSAAQGHQIPSFKEGDVWRLEGGDGLSRSSCSQWEEDELGVGFFRGPSLEWEVPIDVLESFRSPS